MRNSAPLSQRPRTFKRERKFRMSESSLQKTNQIFSCCHSRLNIWRHVMLEFELSYYYSALTCLKQVIVGPLELPQEVKLTISYCHCQMNMAGIL